MRAARKPKKEIKEGSAIKQTRKNLKSHELLLFESRQVKCGFSQHNEVLSLVEV